jgi:hypothetical protein
VADLDLDVNWEDKNQAFMAVVWGKFELLWVFSRIINAYGMALLGISIFKLPIWVDMKHQ